MESESYKNNKTSTYLAEIIILKSQIITKYEYYAKQAKKEGFEQINSIFLETLNQEKNHIKTIFRLLKGQNPEVTMVINSSVIGTTVENLKDAINSEKEIVSKIEEYNKVIWEEGNKKEFTKLKLFEQISSFYIERFMKFSSNIENGTVFKKDKKVKWICRKCGLIHESLSALHNCPGCEHPQAYFEVLAENY